MGENRIKRIDKIIENARITAEGRKFYTAEQKFYIVEEWESSGLTEIRINSGQLYKWRNDVKRGAVMGIKNESELHTKIELDVLKKENKEVKKVLDESPFILLY